MLRVLPLILSLIACLFVSQKTRAGSGIELVPETDRGRVAVRLAAEDPAAQWQASAHEDHIRDVLSRFPRLTLVQLDSLSLSACDDFSCRRQQLMEARVDLYIEGELEGRDLSLRAIVPETEIELSEVSLNLSSLHSPEAVKSSILQLIRPFTEAGGVLDQRSNLRRAVESASSQAALTESKRNLALSLAGVGFAVLVAILTALIIFPDGRRPLMGLGGLWIILVLGPLWLMSEDLALVKPVAIFAIPEPWLLAVLGGLGTGSGLWWLGLCLVPQLRGLEFMKQDRMPLLVKALGTIILYRSIIALLGGATAFAAIYAMRVVYELDAVETVALALVTLGALATLIALFFECCAQLLDRRLVLGRASSENTWHLRVKNALQSHPRLAGLNDILDRALILPTQQDSPVSYGGGFLSAPRILIPLRALEKAFPIPKAADPAEEAEAKAEGEAEADAEVKAEAEVPFDFLWGLVIAGMGSISLRSHLDNTLRLSFGKERRTYGKASRKLAPKKDLFAPYRQARQSLEGAFLAVHEGLAPYVQYLYWRHKPHSDLLTRGAERGQLNEVIQKVTEEINSGRFPLTIDRPRDHIVWLVQTFLRPRQGILPTPEKAGPRRLRGSKLAFVSFVGLFAGYQVLSAALYHPVYVERLALEQAKIDAKKLKKENITHVPEPQPEEAPVPTPLGLQPALRPGSQEVVGSVPPETQGLERDKQKPRAAKAKSKSKSKPKGKAKAKSKLKPQAKSKPNAKPKPKPVAKAGLQPQSKPKSKPSGGTQPKPNAKAKPKAARAER